MARNTRNYPKKSEEELNDVIKKLKSRLRKLQKENKILKEENETLYRAWEQSEKFLEEKLKDIPLETLLKHNKLPKKNTRKKVIQDDTRKEILDEWKAYAQSLKELKDE